MEIKVLEKDITDDYEFMGLRASIASCTFHVFLSYRPSTGRAAYFLSKLTEIFHLWSNLKPLLVLGDFNVTSINNKNQDSFTKKLGSLHKEFVFQQFVKFPTHSQGNILDLVFSTEDLIRSTYPLPLVLSDHTPIVIEMNKMMAREKNLLKFCCYNHEKTKEFVEEFSLFDFDDLVIQNSQHSGFDVVIEKLKSWGNYTSQKNRDG